MTHAMSFYRSSETTYVPSDDDEFRLEAENLDLRRLLAQAGIDAAEQNGAQ